MNENAPIVPENEAVSRRKVLAAAIGVLSALIAAVLGVPSVVSLLGRSSRPKSGRWMKVADVSSLPLGRPVSLRYQEMTERAYVRTQEMRDVWAVRTSAAEVTVFSPICPHLGCRYNWNAEANEFMCPCHGSVFSLEGRVLAGPSPRPLDTLPVKVEAGGLYVQWEIFQVGTRDKVMM